MPGTPENIKKKVIETNDEQLIPNTLTAVPLQTLQVTPKPTMSNQAAVFQPAFDQTALPQPEENQLNHTSQMVDDAKSDSDRMDQLCRNHKLQEAISLYDQIKQTDFVNFHSHRLMIWIATVDINEFDQSHYDPGTIWNLAQGAYSVLTDFDSLEGIVADEEDFMSMLYASFKYQSFNLLQEVYQTSQTKFPGSEGIEDTYQQLISQNSLAQTSTGSNLLALNPSAVSWPEFASYQQAETKRDPNLSIESLVKQIETLGHCGDPWTAWHLYTWEVPPETKANNWKIHEAIMSMVFSYNDKRIVTLVSMALTAYSNALAANFNNDMVHAKMLEIALAYGLNTELADNIYKQSQQPGSSYNPLTDQAYMNCLRQRKTETVSSKASANRRGLVGRDQVADRLKNKNFIEEKIYGFPVTQLPLVENLTITSTQDRHTSSQRSSYGNSSQTLFGGTDRGTPEETWCLQSTNTTTVHLPSHAARERSIDKLPQSNTGFQTAHLPLQNRQWFGQQQNEHVTTRHGQQPHISKFSR